LLIPFEIVVAAFARLPWLSGIARLGFLRPSEG
jgi:hypothetical protein